MPPEAPLYVTDLDGTLIRDDLSLSDWARAELVSLLDEGMAITVATARSIASLSAILGDIPFRLPVVEFGGAFLTDYPSRRHILVNAIEPGRARELYHVLRDRRMEPFLSTWDGNRDHLYYRSVRNEGEKAYYRERIALRDDRLRQVEDLSPGLEEQVISLTLIDREEILRELAADLSQRFDAGLQLTIYAARYSPGWHFLAIHDERATKEGGIRALQEGFGLAGAPLVVFGDDVNDIGMFRAATHAVAVANARQEIKALAHETIGSNEDDSVVRWLRGRKGWRP